MGCVSGFSDSMTDTHAFYVFRLLKYDRGAGSSSTPSLSPIRVNGVGWPIQYSNLKFHQSPLDGNGDGPCPVRRSELAQDAADVGLDRVL